jgi:hypothetical protein
VDGKLNRDDPAGPNQELSEPLFKIGQVREDVFELSTGCAEGVKVL